MNYIPLRKTVISCIVACTLGAPVWATDQAPCMLNVDILKMVDGTSLVNLVEIMKFKSKINSILTQQITKSCSFKDLIKLESQLSESDRTITVQRFIAQFEKTAQPYLQQIHVARDILKPCLAAWMKQRKQPNSLLRLFNNDEFKPGKEHALFIKQITTLKILDQFLEDLHLFLADFTASLPKSLAKYHAALAKVTPR